MRYYYCIDQEYVRGPVEPEVIQQMIRSGDLPEIVLVCKEGSQEWESFSDARKSKTSDNTALKLALGFSGATLLAFGVFCPLVSVPMVGQMNYFQNGQGDGIFILGLAGVTALLCFIRRFTFLWLPGLGSLGLLAYTFVSFQDRLSTAKKSIADNLADNPFAGLAAMAVQSVQIQWGIAVLAIGAILVVASAAIPEKK
ncbi:MAG: GYF domain-containing protein [Deltaproteobacteria bacterium]